MLTFLYVIGFVFVFLAILASGLPVGIGLGVMAMGSLIALEGGMGDGLAIALEKSYQALDSNILVSVPLFVLAAQLISDTGMGKRLFDAAKAFLGRFKAGLGMSTIVSSGVFSAMTGSSFVAASTMGLIAIPELRRAKYPDSLTSAAITAGGSLGAVIPPSIILIIYGYLTDESIGKLFAAGMVPGILLIVFYVIGMMAFSGYIGKDTPVEAGSAESTDAAMSEDITLSKFQALKEGFWGLMAPVIILGGIYLGIFTATEAAAVAVIYCALVGFFIYRNLTIKKLWGSLSASANISSMIAVIVIGGAMLGHSVILGGVPKEILDVAISSKLPPMVLLLVINVILFIMGMFLEILALIYLAIPLLTPLVDQMGWDNVWFAVLFLLNVNLALITPPMGGVLFIVSQIGGIHINTVIKGAMLPVVIILLTMVLLVIFPQIATWLPQYIS